VIGKLDPETGEIIPTGKRGRKKKDPDQDVRQDQALSALTAQISDLQQRILEKEAVISSQNAEIRSLREQNGRLQKIIHKVQMLCADENPAQG
jgi:chromosome segregation ATPase